MHSALETALPQNSAETFTQDHELLQALPAAVYTTDAAGRITFYNEAAAALWGHRPELGSDKWCGSWRLFRPDGRPGTDDRRIASSGPVVMLDVQSTLHLALVLHELATNARKYGALSVPNGRLLVTWHVARNVGHNLHLEWQETGGPKVSAPEQHGFGTTLIARTLDTHGGEASILY